jgi:hypothetical protein
MLAECRGAWRPLTRDEQLFDGSLKSDFQTVRNRALVLSYLREFLRDGPELKVGGVLGMLAAHTDSQSRSSFSRGCGRCGPCLRHRRFSARTSASAARCCLPMTARAWTFLRMYDCGSLCACVHVCVCVCVCVCVLSTSTGDAHRSG